MHVVPAEAKKRAAELCEPEVIGGGSVASKRPALTSGSLRGKKFMEHGCIMWGKERPARSPRVVTGAPSCTGTLLHLSEPQPPEFTLQIGKVSFFMLSEVPPKERRR